MQEEIENQIIGKHSRGATISTASLWKNPPQMFIILWNDTSIAAAFSF